MPFPRGFIAGVALVTLVLGCAPESAAIAWSGTRIDSAGVVIMENSAEGMWPEGSEWTLTEELRIGAMAGSVDYQFGQVGSIAVTTDGEIVVSDRQVLELKVFDAAGTYLRTIGRPGSGPGEFGRGPLDVLLTPGDTLLVPDVRNRRISRFLADGSLLSSAPLDPASERPLRFYYTAGSRTPVAQLRPAPPPDAPAGETADVIRVIESSGYFGDTLLVVPSGGLFAGGNNLRYFTPEPMWIPTDSLTVGYGVNSEYQVSFYDAAGAVQRIVRKAHEPRPIGDRDIRAFFVYLDRAWIANGVSPAQLARNHDRVSFAEYFPAFSVFRMGPAGSLWVQPVQSPADLTDDQIERYNFIEDFGGPAWDVFDADGRFLGAVPMPARFQPRLFDGDVIYGVSRDDFDVQSIVKLRIEGYDPE